MGKITVVLLILSSLSHVCKAQIVKVLDKEAKTAIAHVLIFDEQGKQAITDINGIAYISQLHKGLISFQHLGYTTLVIPKSNIDSTIYLSKSSIPIQEVVVSANKWEDDPSEIPIQITKINREEIALLNPQTMADVLANSGEVFIQKSQLGGGSPMIRGFAANKVLLSVDGVRMNNAIYRSGNLQNVISLDALTTESAEVVFGPGSVMYGSDALGGVMDFHTISPTFDLISGLVFARFSSANLENTGHLILNIGGKKLAFIGAASFSKFNDLRMGTIGKGDYPDFGTRPEYIERINGKDSIVSNPNPNKQVYTGYNQLNFLGKLSYQITDNTILSYAIHSSTTNDVPRYDRLTEYKNDTLKYTAWYYGPQKWLMHHLQLKSTGANNLFTEAKLTFSYQTTEESRHDRKYKDSTLRHRTENLNIITINADASKTWFTNSLFYGIELIYNKVNSTATSENIANGSFSPAPTRYPDGGSTWSSFASYAQWKHYFSTSLILNSGIRYSQVFLSSNFISKSFYNFPFENIKLNNGAVNGSIGLVWKPLNEFQIKSSISSGFRAPNVDDIGKVFDSEPGNVVVPNENLKPEYSYSGEITFTGKINYSFKYNLTGYYTQLVDAMVRTNFTFNVQDSIIYDGELSKVQALTNTGKAFIYGLSANISYTLEKFKLASTLTYTDGQDVVNSTPLRHVSPLFGQTSLTYSHNNLQLIFIQRYNGSKTKEQLAPSELNKPHIYTPAGSPAWTTSTLKAQYNWGEAITLNFGIENIFDLRYRVYASGINAPGRNFIVSAQFSF